MSYTINIYRKNAANTERYLLGKKGTKPLIAVGLNPSTADDQKPDMTIRKVLGFADRYGYDGFIMINLYAHRTPYPDCLPQVIDPNCHQNNLREISTLLRSLPQPNLLAAWSESITVRPYLKECLTSLLSQLAILNPTWWKIGEYTKTGHPRHPSRAAYNLVLNPFDVEAYLEELR